MYKIGSLKGFPAWWQLLCAFFSKQSFGDLSSPFDWSLGQAVSLSMCLLLSEYGWGWAVMSTKQEWKASAEYWRLAGNSSCLSCCQVFARVLTHPRTPWERMGQKSQTTSKMLHLSYFLNISSEWKLFSLLLWSQTSPPLGTKLKVLYWHGRFHEGSLTSMEAFHWTTGSL